MSVEDRYHDSDYQDDARLLERAPLRSTAGHDCMNQKEARIAGYAWALYLPFLADYSEAATHAAFLQWADDNHFPQTDDVFAYWAQGVRDSKWLTHDDEYLSPADISERMGYDYEFILEEIVEGTLPAIDLAGKAAIWAPDARDWYIRLQGE